MKLAAPGVHQGEDKMVRGSLSFRYTIVVNKWLEYKQEKLSPADCGQTINDLHLRVPFSANIP
jgi:hypothetical protein